MMNEVMLLREMQRIREMEYQQAQAYVYHNYMAPVSPQYYHYQPPPNQTGKQMQQSWTAKLAEDRHNNNKTISDLEKAIEQTGPIPKEDLQLMKIELNLRKALSEVLSQRLSTEAARQMR